MKEVIYFIFISIIEAFTKRKEKIKEERIAKHFYSFFGEYKKLPSEKQKEIETIIKEFVRLVQVTSRFVLPYTFYYGPKEYMEMVSKKVESARDEISQVVDVFNESRYSLHLLSEEKKKNFRKLIDLIVDKITKIF